LSSLLHRPLMLLHARGYQEASARDHLVLGVAVSDANTFFISDWDTPNCRAICDGLIPALSAARTALTCPRVNETFASSACRLSLDDDYLRTGSSVGFGWTLGDNLPRRFASSTDAAMSRSSSLSVRYLTALARSLGRTWRCEAVTAAGSVPETRPVVGEPSRTISVEKGPVLLAQCDHDAWADHAVIHGSKQLGP
jgi:hypothetical protein